MLYKYLPDRGRQCIGQHGERHADAKRLTRLVYTAMVRNIQKIRYDIIHSDAAPSLNEVNYGTAIRRPER